jgi:hypothetical protein
MVAPSFMQQLAFENIRAAKPRRGARCDDFATVCLTQVPVTAIEKPGNPLQLGFGTIGTVVAQFRIAGERSRP